ncbi:unnamed protein product [Blumeria hordei]|uniref:Ribokinase n=2 Tax=Blumeria hordei TaxID=2867405 RepID=A0A383UJB9_BLUHO|nr:ribokinase [Blumeria hordei DH14]SZE99957.1 unnamed protein product [Blumeria hordei]
MNTAKIITVIGSLNIDLVTLTSRMPSGGETLTASSFSTGPGGKGGNQATACARLSRPRPTSEPQLLPTSDIIIKLIGAIGADYFGTQIISFTSRCSIDTSGVMIVEGQPTGVAVILVEKDTGENRILLSPGANHAMIAEDFKIAKSLGTPLPNLILLQLEIPLSTVLQIIKTAMIAKVDVLLNPAPAVLLPTEAYQGLTHLIMNETEAATLTGRSLTEFERVNFNWANVTREFIAKGVKNVIVTLGAKGAFFASDDFLDGELVPATAVETVVDTTGAGDTFVGAYAISVVKKQGHMRDIIAHACKAAARTVEKAGSQQSIPWSDEVDR